MSEMRETPKGNVPIAEMFAPVRCAFCGQAYDLGKVTVTARYADCSMWKTPCCDVTADDRGDTGWKSRKDYERIDKNAPSAVDGYDVFGLRVRSRGSRRG